MTDESSDADHEPASGDGDWDSGEGVRGPTRAGVAAAAVIAVAIRNPAAPGGDLLRPWMAFPGPGSFSAAWHRRPPNS